MDQYLKQYTWTTEFCKSCVTFGLAPFVGKDYFKCKKCGREDVVEADLG